MYMYGKNSSGRGPGQRWAMFVVALLLTLGVGCDITEPKAPSWEVEYNIPLLDEWIDLIDLMGDDAFSSFGGDSLYFIEFDASVDPIEIGSEISIGGLDQSVSASMGSFTVPAIPAQTVTVGLTRSKRSTPAGRSTAIITNTRSVPSLTATATSGSHSA